VATKTDLYIAVKLYRALDYLDNAAANLQHINDVKFKDAEPPISKEDLKALWDMQKKYSKMFNDVYDGVSGVLVKEEESK